MKQYSWYCLKCKRRTPSLSLTTTVTKNKRHLVKGVCSVCGTKKAKFVSTTQGAGFINDLLNSGKLPEMHLPGHNFTGPGTRLQERLLRGDKPINQLDSAARDHDVAYSKYKDVKTRHSYDKKLQDEAFKILKDPRSSAKEKMEAGLVGTIMLTKRKLGMGS